MILAQALHEHLKGCTELGCVVNLIDYKLWSFNPDYFSYTLSKAALQAATTMLAHTAAAPINDRNTRRLFMPRSSRYPPACPTRL